MGVEAAAIAAGASLVVGLSQAAAAAKKRKADAKIAAAAEMTKAEGFKQKGIQSMIEGFRKSLVR